MGERRAFFGVLAMTGAQAAKYGLQFAVLPVLARLLGPSAYGLVALAMPFILLANLVSDMGLGNALVRVQSPTLTLESTVFWLSEGACAVLALAICLVAIPASHLFAAPGLPTILIALSPILLIGGSLSVPNARITRERRFAVFAASETTAGFVAAGSAIVAAVAGAGAWSLVVQQLVLWVVKAVWIWVATRFKPHFRLELAAALPHLSFGLHAAAANLTAFLASNAPTMIVGATLGVASVGHYSMAFQLVRMPDSLISGPIYLAIFSAIAALGDDKVRAGEMATRALRAITAGTAPMFLGLAVVADLAVKLFLGGKWIETGGILTALCVAGFLMCFYSVIAASLMGAGQSPIQFRLTLLAGVLINLGALIGAQFNIVGVGIGVSAGALLAAPAYLFALSRVLGLSLPRLALEIARPAVAGLLMAGAVLLLRMEIKTLPDWMQLGSSLLLGATVFGVALAALCGRRLIGDLRELLPAQLARS